MGLRKWVSEKWVDIGAPKKMVSINRVVDQKALKENIQNVFHLQKQNQCLHHKKLLQ